MIGLDSTILIDIARGEKSLQKYLDEQVVLTRLNYLEIIAGINCNDKRYEKELTFFEDMFNSIPIFELDEKSCKKFSELKWKLKSKGVHTPKFDLLIAAIYLRNGVTKILTRNTKHFESIPGIKVITY